MTRATGQPGRYYVLVNDRCRAIGQQQGRRLRTPRGGAWNAAAARSGGDGNCRRGGEVRTDGSNRLLRQEAPLGRQGRGGSNPWGLCRETAPLASDTQSRISEGGSRTREGETA